MKSLKSFLLIAIIVFFASCKNESEQPEVKTVDVENATDTKELDPKANYAKAEFNVEGMTCAMGCAKTIEKNISQMEGVKSATVDFDKKLAMVEFDEAQVKTSDLEATVKKTGDSYSVENMKTVEEFSAAPSTKMEHKMENGKTCGPDCKCENCSQMNSESKETACKDPNCKGGDCKGECKGNAENKMACAKDCKKPCCAKETKA